MNLTNPSANYQLLGKSLPHSLSPYIHKRLFEIKGKCGDYGLLECDENELSTAYDTLRKLNGYNITIPYKCDIIPFLSSLDKSASLYGAVNCVDNTENGAVGYNTDCDGFLLSVKSKGMPLDKKVLLIGCGGVGRMIAIECAKHGADLTIAYIEQAADAATKLKEDILSLFPNAAVTLTLTSEVSGSYDLLINGSPVGMYPHADACPVSDELINNCAYCFDVIYNPVETELVKKFKAQGKVALGGAAMLVYQAVKAHEIWDGDLYTTEEVDAIISEVEAIVTESYK